MFLNIKTENKLDIHNIMEYKMLQVNKKNTFFMMSR